MTVTSGGPVAAPVGRGDRAADAVDVGQGVRDDRRDRPSGRACRTARAGRCRCRSRSSWSRPTRAGPDWASESARGLPSWIDEAATTSAARTAVDGDGGDSSGGGRRSGPRPTSRGWRDRRGRVWRRSSRGPIVARTTGSSVIATATLTSGISMPAMPMLRRNGTGRATSASSEIATVVPLKTTARPACCMALTTAASFARRRLLALLAPAHDDQQRVVDRDGQADQRDEELARSPTRRWRSPAARSAGRSSGSRPSPSAAGRSPSTSAKTKARTSRAPSAGDQRLDGQARATALVAVGGGGAQRVEPGDLDGRAADGRRRPARPAPARASAWPGLTPPVPGWRRARRSCGRPRRRTPGRASRRRTPVARRGSAALTLASAACELARRRRASRRSCPAAASRRGRSGRRRRRCRRSAAMRLLAANASLPGMLNCWSRERSPAGFIAANPPIARTSQRPTTSFL